MKEESEFDTLELKKLGARLRELRKEKDYKTAEEAAQYLDIQRAQYTRYEAGANITYVKLIQILRKLDIPISEFFSKGFD